MSLPPEWPKGYEPTEDEIRQRYAEIQQEVAEARARVEDLEAQSLEFFWAYVQRLPRPPRPKPRNQLEGFLQEWADQRTEEYLKPLSLRYTMPPVNDNGTKTFKLLGGAT